MVCLLSAWNDCRCDTYTVKPHGEVPHNKLNLDITRLALDFYFSKRAEPWEVWGRDVVQNGLERVGNLSGSRKRKLGPCVPRSLLALFS